MIGRWYVRMRWMRWMRWMGWFGWGALGSVACSGGEVALPSDSGSGTPSPTGDPTVPTLVSSTACDACGGDCVIEELAYAERYHDSEPIVYADLPPAGGPHNPCWTTFGAHATEALDDNWVHNLEHGGVAYLYACTDCPDDAAAIAALTEEEAPFALSTPYVEMADVARFAAVAWQFRLLAGCFDRDTFAAFHDAHVDHAPESLASDPGTGCM